MIAFTPIYDIADATEPDISTFDIKIVDDDGNESPDILKNSYTICTKTIMINDEIVTTYTLYANISLYASSKNIIIESEEGEFNIMATVTGLSSYLHDAGLRIELSDTDKTYHSDLTTLNDFKDSYFRDENEARVAFKPNVMYPIAIKTLDDVEHQVQPEAVSDVVITFTAHLKDDLHHIVFFSEGKLIDSYVLENGEAIRPLPMVEREGYEFNGWFTQEGEQIQEGRIVTEADKDIISTAKWTEIPPSSSGTDFNWIVPVIITAAILGLLMIFLVYRRRRSASA